MSLIERKPSFLDNDVWDLPTRMPGGDEPFRGRDLPAVNIKDMGDHFSMEMAVPGYRKEEFKAHVADGVLTVSSARRDESREEKGTYARREFHYTSFVRSFHLPEAADEEAINATYINGILKLTIGKRNVVRDKRGREIPIG